MNRQPPLTLSSAGNSQQVTTDGRFEGAYWVNVEDVRG